MDIGADGLKTGNVDESGYGLAGSAVQNGQRLVVVVNGMKTARDRAAESRKLLELGLPLLRARQSSVRARDRCGRGAGVRRGSPVAAACLRAAGSCPRASRRRRASSRRASSITGPLQGPHQERCPGGKTRGHPAATFRRSTSRFMQARMSRSEPCASALSTACSSSAPVGCAARFSSVSSADLMAGTFITFEGGEGAGKSTQIRALAGPDRGAAGCRVVATREPGGSPYAEEIRAFILTAKPKSFGPFAEALLFAAARIDHLDQTIRPALRAGDSCVCATALRIRPGPTRALGRCRRAADRRAGARRVDGTSPT